MIHSCVQYPQAAQQGNQECLSILLNHGANPDAVDIHGNNALHHAVLRGNISMVEKLLSSSADIEARTKVKIT